MITVVDVSGNVSNQLVISPFTITSATAVTTPATSSSDLATEMQSLESQLSALQSKSSGTAATNYNFTEFLSVGSQDAQVTALQQRLTADGSIRVRSRDILERSLRLPSESIRLRTGLP